MHGPRRARRSSPRRRAAARTRARSRRTTRRTCWCRHDLPACARCRSCPRRDSLAPAPSGRCRQAARPSRACAARRARSPAVSPAGPRPAASVLNSVAGFSSPSFAKTVYARASWTRLTEMPWPYAIVACSIGRQVFGGPQPAGDLAGKSRLRRRAEAAIRRACATSISGGSDSAIFAAPTFDDFWITCSTVSAPLAWVSWIVAGPIVSVPGPVWITVSGRILPESSAAAIVNGFSVEPGSNTSVSARLRILLARDAVARVRVVRRPVGEREDLAGARRRGSRARRPSPCSPRPPP